MKTITQCMKIQLYIDLILYIHNDQNIRRLLKNAFEFNDLNA